jgi:hypothetical protein
VIGAKQTLTRNKFLASLKTAFNGVDDYRPRSDDGGRQQMMVGIRLRDLEATPTITKVYRLDPWMLELGIARTDPQAIMRDARGRAVEMRADEFDD